MIFVMAGTVGGGWLRIKRAVRQQPSMANEAPGVARVARSFGGGDRTGVALSHRYEIFSMAAW